MPYRELGRELTERDLAVPAPGCPCGTSPETRAAYAAVGGWEHTAESAPRGCGGSCRAPRWCAVR